MGEIKDMLINKCRKGCPFYATHGCNLLAGHTLFQEEYIKGCPLETEEIFKNQLIPGGQLEYLAKLAPIEYLKSISYMRRNNLPKEGDLCITLKGGFSCSSPGKLLEVESVDKERNSINLVYPLNTDGTRSEGKWAVTIENKSGWSDVWYESLFVYKEERENVIDSISSCECDFEIPEEMEDYYSED